MKLKKLSLIEYVLYAGIVGIGIALDQLTKWLAVKFLLPIDTVPIIKDLVISYIVQPILKRQKKRVTQP